MAKRISNKKQVSDLTSWNFIIFLTLALMLIVSIAVTINRTSLDIRSQAGFKQLEEQITIPSTTNIGLNESVDAQNNNPTPSSPGNSGSTGVVGINNLQPTQSAANPTTPTNSQFKISPPTKEQINACEKKGGVLRLINECKLPALIIRGLTTDRISREPYTTPCDSMKLVWYCAKKPSRN